MDEFMKKRIVSTLLALVLCIMMLPNYSVMAAEQETTQSFAVYQNYSNWARNDLITADTYGIYPVTWYASDMTKPISKSKLNILISGLKTKLINTGCVAATKDKTVRISDKLTVQEVMKLLYDIACDYTFKPDLKLQKTNYKDFMKQNGIYTGKNGEQSLKSNCSIEQACVIATRLITVIYDKLDAGSKGFFYKTEANGNTVYMLGSIHAGNSELYPLNADIEKAYQASDALGVEIDMTNENGTFEIMEQALFNDGTSLKDHVSKDTYDKVIKVAKDRGYNEVLIKKYKPWYLYLLFSTRPLTNADSTGSTETALNTALGIDIHFLTMATLSGKQILEVEGYGVQTEMLNSFSDDLQEYLLCTTIASYDKTTEGTSDGNQDDMLDILAQWREGDEKEFLKYTSFEYENGDLLANDADASVDALIKEFKEKLFTNRDKKMADYIEKLLTSEDKKTYFIVVGSGHYVSNHDVIDRLTEKGYTITQIK
jgi:uncharacterized protein YbaP (TraB family)